MPDSSSVHQDVGLNDADSEFLIWRSESRGGKIRRWESIRRIAGCMPLDGMAQLCQGQDKPMRL